MKDSFVQSLAWLHSWAGLILGWLLFAVFLTGTVSVFDREIGHWMRPELHHVAGAAPVLDIAERHLAKEASGASIWTVTLPSAREPALAVGWRMTPSDRPVARLLDPADGKTLSPRATDGGRFFVRFHASLCAGRVGVWIVGAASIAMLTTLVSGLVIHRRLFRDFFTFRPRSSAHRAWLDAHNVTGVFLLPFHVMITYSGLTLSYAFYMPAAIEAVYGGDARAYFAELIPRVERPRSGRAVQLLPLDRLAAEAEKVLGRDKMASISVHNPGDAAAIAIVFRGRDDRLSRVSDAVTLDGVTGQILGVRNVHPTPYLVERVLAGLHFAQFGGSAMRWLYFAAGVGSCAMIATGLILFTMKRRRRHKGMDPAAAGFYRVADRINVAAVAGLLVATFGYLYANRVLPVDLGARAEWEIAAFFVIWLATSIHAILRPAERGWVEQLGFAAALALLLPVLDALTSGAEPLPIAAARGDWLSAGVNFTAFAAGIVLAGAARHLSRRTPSG